MVMEDTLLCENMASKTASASTTAMTTELALTRVPSSPVITTSGSCPVTSGGTITSTPPGSGVEARNSLVLEAEDAFTSFSSWKPSGHSIVASMAASVSAYRPPNRRERSLSSITSPNPSFGRGHHQRLE